MPKANGARMARMIMCGCIVLDGEDSVCGGFGDTCEMRLYFQKYEVASGLEGLSSLIILRVGTQGRWECQSL